MAIVEEHAKWRVRVVPKKILVHNAVLSLVLIWLPVFGSLHVLGIPKGMGALVLTAELVSLAVAAFAYIRYRMTFIGVTGDQLTGRGFLSLARSAPLSSVESVVLVETYRAHATDSTPQLLLRDRDGKRILRMRGTFWTEKSMRTIAGVIERPLVHAAEPVTKKEFFDTYPSAAYWFENRPSVTALFVVITSVASLGVVLGLMSLAGIPITGGN
ncbi:MAG: hypothetical protein JWL94_2072 [Microbacteriaceae bacterium]|jgi:hypothetical protein|nr:hypothetical protein [Microbacteriaceae bacterium]